MSSELININLIIADRPYPLKVKPEEEERVRNAARDINNKVKQFQTQYAGKDKQDFLAMSALMFAVEASSYQNKTVINDSSFGNRLDELDQLLTQALKG